MNTLTIAECCKQLAEAGLPFRHGVRDLVSAEMVRLAKIAKPWGQYWVPLRLHRSNCSRARSKARLAIAAYPAAAEQAEVITRLAHLLIDEEKTYQPAIFRLTKEYALAMVAVAGNKSAAARKLGCHRSSVIRLVNGKGVVA